MDGILIGKKDTMNGIIILKQGIELQKKVIKHFQVA